MDKVGQIEVLTEQRGLWVGVAHTSSGLSLLEAGLISLNKEAT
jgi:hypothetical protein